MDLPLATYAPNANGTPRQYGPFRLDKLTEADTKELRLTFTIEPDWPNDTSVHLFRLRAEWDTGDAAEWIVHGGLKNRDGTPATTITLVMSVPLEGSERKRAKITRGDVTIFVLHPFSTAVSVESA
jgi:hypothetical protein